MKFIGEVRRMTDNNNDQILMVIRITMRMREFLHGIFTKAVHGQC